MQAQWIESNHPIFDSAAYQRDSILFNVLNRAINPTAFLRLSDGEYYIIAPHIAQGMHAVIYADSKNPFSNAAYRRIGFELQGELLEIQMTQEERTP
ncbi:MAG: hypothetical protein ACOX63_12860 [Christensenellales bacterium]|jgi:hypothetical protein